MKTALAALRAGLAAPRAALAQGEGLTVGGELQRGAGGAQGKKQPRESGAGLGDPLRMLSAVGPPQAGRDPERVARLGRNPLKQHPRGRPGRNLEGAAKPGRDPRRPHSRECLRWKQPWEEQAAKLQAAQAEMNVEL